MTQLGCRAEYLFGPDRPRNGAEAHDRANWALERYLHLYALNRGILLTPFHNMALMSPATTEADVDRHTEVFREAVLELAGRPEQLEPDAANRVAVEIGPGTITCAFRPRSRSSRPSGRVDELERVACRSAPRTSRSPCGAPRRSRTTTRVADREPAASRKALLVEAHVDDEVVAGERPALRLGDEPEQSRVDAIVSWFSR